MNAAVTYSLVEKEQNSGSFYIMLNVFTDLVLDSAYIKLGNSIDDYTKWLTNNKIEKVRSKEEYILELITLGIFWNNYASKAIQTNRLSKKIIAGLYKMRKQYPRLKKQLDKLRGFVSYGLLEKRNRFRVEVYSLENYRSLLEWLEATGEFDEEVIRLKNWLLFFKTLSPGQISEILHKDREFGISFNDIGRSVLGGYTQNVDSFRMKALEDYKYREDYFFVLRSENEYFLNMFGAEVMNRQLKPQFDKAPHKAVLLPTCMRKKSVTECRATSDGKEKVCRICDSDCAIGKVAKEFVKESVPVYLIPHSSNFSKFLIHWANQKETALVGVACTLNLLTGGYEMKRLNIASQCVFLDYCSCKNHWNKQGQPTSLNINRLKQLFVPENKLQEAN
jgi:uncharacterized protein